MALQGVTAPRYSPEDLLLVAEFLGKPVDPNGEKARTQVLRIAAEKLARLLAFAETQPESWKLLIQFIGESVQQKANEAVAVDPFADPVGTHGFKCFKSGGAQALLELAQDLLPDAIKKKLDKTLALCQASKEE